MSKEEKTPIMDMETRKTILFDLMKKNGLDNELHPCGKIWDTILEAMWISAGRPTKEYELYEKSEEQIFREEVSKHQKRCMDARFYVHYRDCEDIVRKGLQKQHFETLK